MKRRAHLSLILLSFQQIRLSILWWGGSSFRHFMQSTKYLSPRAKSQRKRRRLRATRPEEDRPRGERSEGFGVGEAHDVTGKRRALVGHGRFGREFDPTVATPPRTSDAGYEFHLERSPVSVFEQPFEVAACFRSNLGHQRRALIGVGNLYGIQLRCTSRPGNVIWFYQRRSYLWPEVCPDIFNPKCAQERLPATVSSVFLPGAEYSLKHMQHSYDHLSSVGRRLLFLRLASPRRPRRLTTTLSPSSIGCAKNWSLAHSRKASYEFPCIGESCLIRSLLHPPR